MGGQADGTEDMFAKLESMREVITEVNSQFKDPVRTPFVIGGIWSQPDIVPDTPLFFLGKDHIRVCLYIRVPVPVRDRASDPRAHRIRD